MSRQEAFKKLSPIAYKAAEKYRRRLPVYECTEDILNVALMGVWEAVNKHYGQDGRRLAALAFIRAHGAIADYLRQRDWASRRTRFMKRPYTMTYLDERDDGTSPTYAATTSTTTPEDEASSSQLGRLRQAALDTALATLSESDRAIVRRLLAGDRQLDIARDMKLSAARISQILAKVLPLLQKSVRATSNHKSLW